MRLCLCYAIISMGNFDNPLVRVRLMQEIHGNHISGEMQILSGIALAIDTSIFMQTTSNDF